MRMKIKVVERWAEWIKENEWYLNLIALAFFLLSLASGIVWLVSDRGESVAFVFSVLSALFFGLVPASKYCLNDLKIRDMGYDDIIDYVLKTDPRRDWKNISTVKGTDAFLIADVRLRFVVLHGDEGIHNDDFREEWANKHPDRRAQSFWCDLYYGGGIINRFVLVAVDGSRAYLPIPHATSFEISEIDYRVAQIHDESGTLDEYIGRSGLIGPASHRENS